MKYEDNSIHIGDKCKIKESAIGHFSKIENLESNGKERCYSKIFWKVFIPISVVVISAVICFWLGLN